MERKGIRAIDVYGVYHNDFEYDEVDECPLCHFALQPNLLDARYVEGPDSGCHLYITYFCTKCRKVFLANYLQLSDGLNYHYANAFKLTPVTPNHEKFTQQIKDLSPMFVSTYAQSQQAEASGLTEICGIGYRKALEYLVKDYLCHVDPEHEEDIKKELLGKSIKRIDNSKVKILAERSTWIGNDETHYVRKHEDLDVSDMKRFIIAMVRYVDAELAFEDAESIEHA